MSTAEPLLPPTLSVDEEPFDPDDLVERVIELAEIGDLSFGEVVDELLSPIPDRPDPGPDPSVDPVADWELDHGHKVRYRIVNDDDAEWAMAIVAQAATDRRDVTARLDARIAKLRAWADHEVRKPDATINFFAALLEDYAIRERIRTKAKRKTVTLASGDVKTTEGSVAKYELVDADEFETWAAASLTVEQYEACVKTTVAPKMDPLKKITSLEPGDSDTARILLDGEPVAGIVARLPHVSASVKPSV